MPPFALASDPAYGNITQVPLSFSVLTAPEPVDVIFTAQGIRKRFFGGLDYAIIGRKL